MSAAGPAGPRRTRPHGLRLLPTGERAFGEMLSCLAAARRSVLLRAFVWRDDETGRSFARALRGAADRGVRVTIRKDVVGAIYEHFDENQRSFLHDELDVPDRVRVELLRLVYARGRRRDGDSRRLAGRILVHPNIRLLADRRLYDHSKVLLVDGETLFVGGMGIGDEFRHKWLDLMVRLDGRHHVARYARRLDGAPTRSCRGAVEFLVNARRADGGRSFPILERRLRAIAETRRRLTMEMAYLGDRRVTDALVDLVRRGAGLTLVVSARANVVHDLNTAVVNELLERTGGPPRLRIVQHPRMVHTKLTVYDDRAVQLGSANCTPLSHDGYGETDLWIEDRPLARRLAGLVERHAAEGFPVRRPLPSRSLYVAVERALQRWHGVGRDAPATPVHAVSPRPEDGGRSSGGIAA